MRCQIAEDDEPAVALEKLRATLSEHLLDEDERRFVEPRARAAARGRRDEDARPAGALRGLAALLRAPVRHRIRPCSSSRTCSGPTRACSTSSSTCSSGRAGHRLYVITLARPELLEKRATWGAGQRSFTSIYLEPLGGAGDGGAPGRASCRACPRPLRTQILARAEGVPLYAVETVRMLLDRGLLGRMIHLPGRRRDRGRSRCRRPCTR